jgi:Ca-activated chloride channel family protein
MAERRSGRHSSRERSDTNIWTFVAGGAVLVVVLAVLGFAVLHHDSSSKSTASDAHCGNQPAAITVAAAPDIAPTLTRLAAAYTPGGACVIRVTSTQPAAVLAGVGKSGTPQPDVWIPDSSLWSRLGATSAVSPATAAVIPTSGTSLASSPLVIAMPRPMAAAATAAAKSTTMGWRDAFNLSHTTSDWGKLGHPEWGPIVFGLTDVQQSSTQIEALLAISADVVGTPTASALPTDQVNSAGAQAVMIELGRRLFQRAPTTADLLTGLRAAGGGEKGLKYVSMLPASEQQVAAYNRSSPPIPLTAVYATKGSPANDYPYLVLKPARTGDPAHTAAAFLTYLQSPAAQQALTADGFRTPASGGPFTAANGLAANPTPTTLATTTGATVDNVQRTWTGLTFTPSGLSVLAASNSLGADALATAKQTSAGEFSFFAGVGNAGLWVLPGPGGADHRVAVPYGPLPSPVNGVDRTKAIEDASNKVTLSSGGVRLYDAIEAAYQSAVAAYQPGSSAGIGVYTDGKDTGSKLTLSALVASIKSHYDPSRPVRIFMFAFGPNQDLAGMRKITDATNGITFTTMLPGGGTAIALQQMDATFIKPANK